MKYKLISQKEPNHDLLTQILISRGITDPYHYTHTTEADIPSYKLLGEKRLKRAATMLVDTISNNSDAYVVVDADIDGFTSAATLGNWLHDAFPTWTEEHLHYYHHKTKAHGLNDCIDYLAAQPIKLVVCPDSASNDLAEQKLLAENGIQCFCLDHHNGVVDEAQTPAVIISNNITYTDSENTYPDKSVSGVWITYCFCKYLDELLETDYADKYLDLVAAGDIADVMSLVNNYALRQVLNMVEAQGPKNPLIKALIDKNEYSTGGQLNVHTCGWVIGPLTNAVIRIGSLDDKKLLFDSMLEYKANRQVPSTKRGHKGEMESIVDQAVRLCESMRRKQNKLRDQLSEEIDNIIQEKDLLKNKVLLVKIDDPTEEGRGITGLVANKIMSKYEHPALLLNKTFDPETGELIWSGSARNNPTLGIESFQKFVKESGDFILAEGHNSAYGASIPDSNVAHFINWSNEKLKDIDFSPIYKVDIIADAKDLRQEDILSIADASDLWGQGIDEPLICVHNVPITDGHVHLYGGSTLKFDLGNGISAVKFKASEEEFAQIDPGQGCTTVDIIGTCKRNTGWDNGAELIITDYEVTGKQEWYF